MEEYRFFMSKGNGGKTPVTPIYKDLNLEYNADSDECYFRKELSGKLTFVRNDYTIIKEANVEDVFFVYVQKLNPNGQYEDFFTGKFFKTDCTINETDKTVIVSLTTDDDYTDLLAGIENEYDIIKLAIATQNVTIYKRPLVQIYALGSSVLSCYMGGVFFEHDVPTPITDRKDLLQKYFFAVNTRIIESVITPSGGASEQYAGLYAGYGKGVSDTQTNYEATKFGRTEILNFKEQTDGTYIVTLNNDSGDILYQYSGNLTGAVILNGVNGNPGTLSLSGRTRTYYARILCDVEDYGSKKTNALPVDDIVDNNRNYQRVIGYSAKAVYVSNRLSDDVTEWGRAGNDQYFMEPYSLAKKMFLPTDRSKWVKASYWYAFDVEQTIIEQKGRKEYILRDAYELSSCIKAILQKISPDISHEPTPEYSRFLYGSTPIKSIDFNLLLTPKSNIINGMYQTPAQKGPITLQQILDMLKNVFKCYWMIKDKKLIIEHIEWFRRGQSYDTNQNIGYDLTALKNVRNGKSWAFATSEYKYEKENMPERYQFAWMDDVSLPFTGWPIEIKSAFVEKGKIEDVTIGNFTSDIDMMLLNPQNMSSDGFALMAAVDDGGQYKLPIDQIELYGQQYVLQNYYLATGFTERNFFLYDMPAQNLRINETDITANSVRKGKKQEINFPADLDINVNQLVKTDLGNGQIEKISVNLGSHFAKATLKYDTE